MMRILSVETIPGYRVQPGDILSVKTGQKVRITVGFEYQGPEKTVTLYGTIGNAGVFGFDEVLHGERPIKVPESTTWQYVKQYVDIKITPDISSGIYSIQCKIKEDPKATLVTLENVIDVQKTEVTWKGVVLIAGLGIAGALVLATMLGQKK